MQSFLRILIESHSKSETYLGIWQEYWQSLYNVFQTIQILYQVVHEAQLFLKVENLDKELSITAFLRCELGE